jgi:ATP-independent RNA helicase DbpA
MIKPHLVQVDTTHDNNSISQHFLKVEDNVQRLKALRLLLLKYRPDSALVFCNTKRETQEVADKLISYGFSAIALHGDMEQRDRDETLVRFANKSISILVATDVAARGLDIDTLDAVINYHVAHDTETHTHRIGRTGRAGSKGIACTLFSDKESYKVALLESDVDPILENEALPPDHLLENKPAEASMSTLLIDGGKKDKVRPGDILGALTGKNGITGKQVGKINLYDRRAYVAISRDAVNVALTKLNDGKLKGRSFRVRLLRD